MWLHSNRRRLVAFLVTALACIMLSQLGDNRDKADKVANLNQTVLIEAHDYPTQADVDALFGSAVCPRYKAFKVYDQDWRTSKKKCQQQQPGKFTA
jgi:hypothetical protein